MKTVFLEGSNGRKVQRFMYMYVLLQVENGFSVKYYVVHVDHVDGHLSILATAVG